MLSCMRVRVRVYIRRPPKAQLHHYKITTPDIFVILTGGGVHISVPYPLYNAHGVRVRVRNIKSLIRVIRAFPLT